MDPAYHDKSDAPADQPSDADQPSSADQPSGADQPSDAEAAQAELPTRSDLDHVAADLDQIDAKLAALDDQR
jgi:hypothetical protein